MAASAHTRATAAVVVGGLAVGWAWRTYQYDREKMEEDTRRIQALAVVVAEEEIRKERERDRNEIHLASNEKED